MTESSAFPVVANPASRDRAGEKQAGEEAVEGISVAEAVHRPDPEPATLGEYLYRERQRTATLQRVLTARSGVSQPNIAAYERGRRQPGPPRRTGDPRRGVRSQPRGYDASRPADQAAGALLRRPGRSSSGGGCRTS